MTVGYFGNMKFVTSSKKVNSFSNLKRTASARWAEHNTYNGKPLTEFLGPDLQSVTFKIIFDINLGVTPEKEIRKWVKLIESGSISYLVIGSRKIGSRKWRVKSISEELDVVFANGRIVRSSVEITMSEC